MSIYSKFQKNIASYYATAQEKCSGKEIKRAILGISLLTVIIGGFFIYRYSTQRREQQAFESLMEVISSFNQEELLKNTSASGFLPSAPKHFRPELYLFLSVPAQHIPRGNGVFRFSLWPSSVR